MNNLTKKQLEALVALFGDLLAKATEKRLKQGRYVEGYLEEPTTSNAPFENWQASSRIMDYAGQVKDWGLLCGKECTLARVVAQLEGKLDDWNKMLSLPEPIADEDHVMVTTHQIFVHMMSVMDTDRRNLDSSVNYWVRDVMTDVGHALARPSY